MTTRKMLCYVSAVAALALSADPVLAGPGHAEHSHGTHEGGTAHSHKVPSLESVPDILAAVRAKQAELAAAVADKRLSDVHLLAFAVRDLALLLREKAPAERRERLRGTLNNISTLAGLLDRSGDAGDQAGTEANLKKLDGILKVLEAQVGVK